MTIEQIETGSIPQSTKRANPPEQLRIVTWNIERGHRLDAVAEFLVREDADLVLLQEVDKNCRRTGNLNVARELSTRLQMNYAYAVEFHELTQGSDELLAYHGQATLSPWPLLQPRLMRFRNQTNFWKPSRWIPTLSPFQRRLGGRMALVTEVCVRGTRLTAYNLHLESRGGDDLRCAQLRELLDDIARRDVDCPVIIGGDFNFDVSQPTQSLVITQSGFENPFSRQSHTTAVTAFGRRKPIDCLLTRGRFHVVAANVRTYIAASDHYPLTLTLLFGANASAS